jgi:hypothetical protein
MLPKCWMSSWEVFPFSNFSFKSTRIPKMLSYTFFSTCITSKNVTYKEFLHLNTSKSMHVNMKKNLDNEIKKTYKHHGSLHSSICFLILVMAYGCTYPPNMTNWIELTFYSMWKCLNLHIFSCFSFYPSPLFLFIDFLKNIWHSYNFRCKERFGICNIPILNPQFSDV